MTPCVAMRLECPGLETLALDGPNVGAAMLDLGDADTRAVVLAAPDADGTIDTTALIGARPITLQVLLSAGSTMTRWALSTRLRAFTAPGLRPSLFVQFTPDDPELMVTLRRGPFAEVWTPKDTTRAKVTVQWIAPLGVLESALLRTMVANASAGGAEVGRVYDLTFDRTYATSPTVGSASMVNAGNHTAYPVIRVYGPATNPTIQNVTQGRTMAFTGLAVLAGEFLEINTRTKTIRYNGLAIDSRYSTLVFPTSSWLALVPGTNFIRYLPATSSPPSNAAFEWRDAYL